MRDRAHFYPEVRVRRPQGRSQFARLLDDGERAPGQAKRQEADQARPAAARAGIADARMSHPQPKQSMLGAMDGSVNRGMEAAGHEFPLERVPGLHFAGILT